MKTPMLRSSLVAAMLLAFSGGAGAAGLGRINVLSTLGQPLRAEVEISASPEELESMSAKMASPDAFQRANIEYSGAFSAVRMSIEKRSERGAVLRITSSKPFSEPFVDLLLELNWAGGRLLREYTFLLDPAQDQPLNQKAVVSIDEPVVKSLEPAGKKAGKRAAREVTPPVADAPPRDGDGYTVKRGDTISKIAAELKPVEVTQEQMVAALYKANAEAFAGGNINRIRTGKVLRVPDAEETKQVDARAARKVILRASNFDIYKSKVAEGVAATQARDVSDAQSSSGKVESKVMDQQPSGNQKNTVTVTSTQVNKSASKKTARTDDANPAQLKALQDDVATKSRAVEEANSRVRDLERQIVELKKLVDLKSQSGANAQQAASSAAVQSKPVEKPAEPKPVEPVVVASVPVDTPVQSQASAPSEVAAQSEAVQSVPAKAPEAAVSAVAKAPAQEKPAEDDAFNTLPLLGGGLLIAALGGAFVWNRQRKRKASTEDLSQLSEVSTMSPNSVFGNAVGQTVDTGSTGLHTDFSQSGMSAIDADEGVDPVAEADVYMAYGRDAQAEEILLDALKTDPARTAIYVKLLEIYSARQSVSQFEKIASDLHARTGGVGEDWNKAVALGAQVSPANPLFQPSAPSAPVLAAATAIPAAEVAEPVSFGTNNVSQMRSTWTVPGEIAEQLESGAADVPLVVDLPETMGTATTTDALNLDFNLDLDSPDVEDLPTRIEQRVELSPEQDQALELTRTAPELPVEVDLGVTTSAVVATAESDDIGIERARENTVAELDLEKTNFEGSLLDFDFELSDDSPKPPLDLSSVNLGAPVSSTTEIDLPEIGDSIDVNDEVTTKLELARAYEEMGDVEGARELLDEVAKDGSQAQKDEAKALLQRLGS